MTAEEFKILKNIFLSVRVVRTLMLYNELVERGCGLLTSYFLPLSAEWKYLLFS